MAASQSMQNIQFSGYYVGLEGPAKPRYKEKGALCDFDLYALTKSDFKENINLLLSVQYQDGVNYLFLQTSWSTSTKMKVYKSLKAYNFFVLAGLALTVCYLLTQIT